MSAAILCGGQSRRFGRDKSLLTMNGEYLIERMIKRLSAYPDLMLSVSGANSLPSFSGARLVYDKEENCGPMGGLCAILESARYDTVFVTACDLPFADSTIAEALLRHDPDRTADILVPETADGRLHMVSAIYRKSCLPVIKQQIKAKDYRLRLLPSLVHAIIVTDLSDDQKAKLYNVNYPRDWNNILTK